MRRLFAFSLMICMSAMPVMPRCADDISPARGENDTQIRSSKEPKRQAAFREKMELMGRGARVQIAMRGSSAPVKYVGSVDEISTEGFKLKMNDRTLRIGYDMIETLTSKERSYKAAGEPDPVRVRTIAAGIGAGNKTKIRLISGQRLGGIIQSIEKDGFTIATAERALPIKFAEVTEIKYQKFPAWGIAAIAVGAACALLFVLYAATYED